MAKWVAEGIKQFFVDAFRGGIMFIADNAFPVMLTASLVTLIIVMCGAKRARTLLYWEVVIYGLIEMLKAVII